MAGPWKLSGPTIPAPLPPASTSSVTVWIIGFLRAPRCRSAWASFTPSRCLRLPRSHNTLLPETAPNVSALIEQIAKWMVDAPDEVYVEHLDDDVIELEVAEEDVGKIIG